MQSRKQWTGKHGGGRRGWWLAATGMALLLGTATTALLLAGQPTVDAAQSHDDPVVGPLAGMALTVEVVSPRRTTMPRSLRAGGTVAAREELVIGSDAAGVRLLEVLVDTGSAVRRGQLLARGDDRQLQAQRAQLEARIRQARAELEQAESNHERAERIRESGVYSAEAVQTRRTAAQASAARLDLAIAQREEVEVRIEQTRVTAPVNGVIARRVATVGSVMQPGSELFRLLRDNEIEWRAEVPDLAIGQVKVGALARVRIDGTRQVQGRVRLVAPTVDTRTRNGIVHVSLPRGTALKAGSHVQGDLLLGSAERWVLPESVVFSRDGQAYVFVVGAQSVARSTRVDVGVRHDGLVEVSGLPPGARVVATGSGFVKDGERVRVAAQAAGARS